MCDSSFGGWCNLMQMRSTPTQCLAYCLNVFTLFDLFGQLMRV